MGRSLLAASILAAGAVAAGLSAAQTPVAPGELSFKAHNAVYQAEGRFESWRITKVDIPEGDLTKGTVEIEVDLGSVREKADKLTAHLRTPDFLDVVAFSKATISIGSVKLASPKHYQATATLELHGIKGSCPVAFEVISEKPLEIKGTATLDRSAFKIGAPYDPADKYAPHNEVEIALAAKLQ